MAPGQAKQDQATGDQTTRWWWVRHAPSKNPDARIFGASDVEADLTDKAAINRLARALPGPAIWLTTPYLRTRATAMALQAARGSGTPVDDSRILEEPEFREQHMGAWEGCRWDEITGTAADAFWRAPATTSPPGGESFFDVTARTTRRIAELNEAYDGCDIISVAHAGTIRASLVVALDITPAQALRFEIAPLSLTRIDRVASEDAHSWRVKTVNTTL